MRRLLALVPLVVVVATLAPCGGCATTAAAGEGWFAVGVTVLKEPKFDALRITKQGIGVSDYDGISKATGADVVSAAASVARLIVRIP